VTLNSGVGTTKRFVKDGSWEIKGFIAVVQLLGIRSFTEKAFRETAEATISVSSDTTNPASIVVKPLECAACHAEASE